ncbi:hypothetical protein M0G74_00840 [Microbulbifer sp. CAU 1566]|uniref:hypothetical protein n=1 Tax=Microbulbifer sp. CAU 1566 TaxID=2933269 RepID=UPI002004F85D|nr:hypothetical protein [Microbulbifer sp. CAU 1566]MCK7595810.1 hypothetical protein [Microbulbifer sp. CAU 1566]
MKEQILNKAVEAGGRLTVKSALNPILWLCGIITIPTLIAGSINPELSSWVVAVGCAPVIAALFGFLFLLFFDRDKLQSEDYQLRKRTIEYAQSKGDPLPMEIRDSIAVENPDAKAIPHDEEGK